MSTPESVVVDYCIVDVEAHRIVDVVDGETLHEEHVELSVPVIDMVLGTEPDLHDALEEVLVPQGTTATLKCYVKTKAGIFPSTISSDVSEYTNKYYI